MTNKQSIIFIAISFVNCSIAPMNIIGSAPFRDIGQGLSLSGCLQSPSSIQMIRENLAPENMNDDQLNAATGCGLFTMVGMGIATGLCIPKLISLSSAAISSSAGAAILGTTMSSCLCGVTAVSALCFWCYFRELAKRHDAHQIQQVELG